MEFVSLKIKYNNLRKLVYSDTHKVYIFNNTYGNKIVVNRISLDDNYTYSVRMINDSHYGINFIKR